MTRRKRTATVTRATPQAVVDAVEYRLPLPPSANNLFANVAGRGRIKSAEYRAWEQLAWGAVLQQGVVSVPSPVRVTYVIHGGQGMTRARDGFNFEKALSDLAVRCGVLKGDSLMHVVGGGWDYVPPADKASQAWVVIRVERVVQAALPACSECNDTGWAIHPENGRNPNARRCGRGCPSSCSVCSDPNCDNLNGQH